MLFNIVNTILLEKNEFDRIFNHLQDIQSFSQLISIGNN